MTSNDSRNNYAVMGRQLGISNVSSSSKVPLEFLLIDFIGIYLFQQFFTILFFSLLSAFVLPPSALALFQHVWGEGGAMGIVTLPANMTRQTMLLGASLAGNFAVVVLYVFRGRSVYRMSWAEMGWQKAPIREVIRWTLLFYPLVIGFTFGYNLLLKLLEQPLPSQQVATFLSPEKPLLMRVFAIILVLFAAPVMEEFLYRGLLFSALKKYLSFHEAAVLSGLLFGLAHMEWMTILPLAFLGYLLALSYEYSRSIWLPIGLHACNNLLAFLFLLFLSPK